MSSACSFLTCLDTLQLLFPRFEQLDSTQPHRKQRAIWESVNRLLFKIFSMVGRDIPLMTLCKAAFSCERILLGLEEADHLIETRFELVESLLESVWIFDGAENRALGTVGFDRIRISCSTRKTEEIS